MNFAVSKQHTEPNRDDINVLRLLLKSYWIAISTEWFKVDYNCDRLSGHVTQALRHQILILSTVTYGIRNIPGSSNPKFLYMNLHIYNHIIQHAIL